jgi:hypothetical protein
LVAIFYLTKCQYRADLRQRFNDENTGHDWCTWKVTLKKRFVDAHLLDTHNAFARYQLDYSID